MNFLLLFGVAGIYAILAVLLWIAVDLRTTPGRRFGVMGHYDPHVPGAKGPARFSTVWEWREGRWEMISSDVPKGVDPGPAPAYSGAFGGEVVKTWVVVRSS